MNGPRFFFNLPKNFFSSCFAKHTSYSSILRCNTKYSNLLSGINRERNNSTHIHHSLSSDSCENLVLHSATSFVRGTIFLNFHTVVKNKWKHFHWWILVDYYFKPRFFAFYLCAVERFRKRKCRRRCQWISSGVVER